ncbi:hypothetical protein RI054_05g29570 [Pseudoscourfieldia marina]
MDEDSFDMSRVRVVGRGLGYVVRRLARLGRRRRRRRLRSAAARDDVRTPRNQEALHGSWEARLVGWDASSALNYLTSKTRVQGNLRIFGNLEVKSLGQHHTAANHGPYGREGLRRYDAPEAREIPQQTTDAILNALDKKKYDGRRRLPSPVQGGCGALEEVGFYNIERDIKLENLEEIDEETWVRYYSVPDRRYIYTDEGNASQAANDAYENEKKNGILLLHRLWKLHGAPNLANTISADGTRTSKPLCTKIPLRTCACGAYFDRVFPRHTGQHEDRLAHADGEYRQIPRILDSMKIPGMVIPTYLELKR